MRRLLTCGNVEIMCSTGRSWSVELQNREGQLKFTNGWLKFVRDVGLKKGNLVVFRQVADMRFVYRHYNNGFRLVSGISVADIEDALQFNFCRILNEAISDDAYLVIPDSYAAPYADFSDKMTIQIPNGKQWIVGLKIVREEVWLYHGWCQVCRCLNLGKGALLLFSYKPDIAGFALQAFDPRGFEVFYD